MSTFHTRYTPSTPRNTPKRRFVGDLTYKEVVFVYPVTLVKDSLGSNNKKTYPAAPAHSISASFQETALISERTEPQQYGNRRAHIYTRHRDHVRFMDRVKCRGILMDVLSVIDKFDNFTGDYQYTLIKVGYSDEKDSVNRG